MKKAFWAIFLAFSVLLCSCGGEGFFAPGSTVIGGTGSPTQKPSASESGTGGSITEAPPVIVDPEAGKVEPATKNGNPTDLFQPVDAGSRMPVISLTVNQYSQLLGDPEQNYYATTVSVSEAALAEYNVSNLAGEIRCRGNATFNMAKKSFRLRLESAANLLGVDGGPARNWVLLAEHCDQSLMRNHVAQAMASVLGIAHSSSSFVELYINGQYEGVYHLLEHAQIQEYRLNLSSQPGVADTDYLIELDSYADLDGVEGTNWFWSGGKKYGIKNELPTAGQCAFLKTYFRNTETALQGGDKATIEQYIDIDSFVDMYILQAFLKNIDVGYSSFYYVKRAGGKLACAWPWDFDLAMGNDERLDNGSAEGLYVGDETYKESFDQYHVWFGHLMKTDWFRAAVKARYAEVADKMEQVAHYEIERLTENFGDAFARNFDRWEIFGTRVNMEPEAVMALTSHQEHVAYLESWITARRAFLDEYFASLS